MYNQDNREKVERDERAHEAEELLLRQKHEAAESEHRRQLLLARARGTRPPPRLQARLASERRTATPACSRKEGVVARQEKKRKEAAVVSALDLFAEAAGPGPLHRLKGACASGTPVRLVTQPAHGNHHCAEWSESGVT